MAVTAEAVLATGAMLGEGPAWIDGALWFVDIKRPRIHRFDPSTGTAREWLAPDQIGWVLPADDGTMLAGLRNGIHRFDPGDGSFEPLLDPEPDRPANRLNDAATDCRGRLWFGSMDDAEAAATGRLYRFEGGRCVDAGVSPVIVTNGPAISADATMLYHTDSIARTIWRHAIHDDGTLAPGEPHIMIEEDDGVPDGSVIDAEGCLWVGLWAGWSLRRYDPAGALMTAVRLPCANVTKLAFGSGALDTAYVTTARAGLDAAALAGQPRAGDLFAFDPGVAGLPITPVRMASGKGLR